MTPSPTPSRPAIPGKHPQPTSGQENSRAMWWVAGMVALALVAVLGFNLLGPRGDASGTGLRPAPATTAPAGEAPASR